jgi:two-component system cell cycle sensor histidine kinase/response regulator CckA
MARILIADDERLIRLQLEEMLTGLGYAVVGQAESGREAVDMARDLKPDLILMDVAMPGEKNSIEAAQEIKTALDIPIIFTSGYGDPEYIEAAKQVEPFGYVMKPFDEKGIRAFVEIALDISTRKQAEESFRISKERMRQIIDFLPDATFVIDTGGKVVAWNHAIEKMTGIRAKDMLEKGDFEYAIPFYGKRRPVLIDLVSRWDKEAEAAYKYVKKEEEALVSETYDCLVKPGGTLWNKASLLYDENGEVTGAIESIRDITERKKYEESLRESEEKYRALFEQARDAIVITTEHGDVIDANTFALNLFGYSKEAMMDLNFQHLYVDPDDGFRFRKEIEEKGSVDEFFTRLRRSDGLEMDCTINAVVHRDSSKGTILGYQGIIRDITESRRVQMQLQESRKTEAVATLAGGIAHQFNNALTPIMGNIDLICMDHGQDKELMESLKQMKASGRRMANLTSQLLAYARGGKYNVQLLSPDALVLGTIPLVEHTLHPDVRVETDLPPGLSAVKADLTQMQMVLSALIANANEAMEGPGRIRIAAADVNLDQKFMTYHGLRPGAYVCVSVEDTGKGMDEETRKRIFDPFFTTNFLGRGLGMAAVYGIVKNHGGAIEVDSELGRGTVVRICLPAVRAGSKEQGAKDVKAPGIEPGRMKGTILVIEDDEMVMDLVQAMLERLGYRVLGATTGEEAVDMARTFDGDIDLALLDIKLPDMSGNQVYPLIMAARPDLKVVVCSGYAIDGPAKEILNSGAQGFIQKPFSLATLAEKVRSVLAGRDDLENGDP